MKRINIACIVFLMLLGISAAHAWNASGHMLTATIAWEQLDEETRREIVSILRQHERFELDFIQRMPEEIRNAAQEIQDKWIFAHAARWSDIARGFKDADRDKYHRSRWHYINIPAFLTAEDEIRFRKVADDPTAGYDVSANLEMEWTPGGEDYKLNIIQALARSQQLMRDAATSPAQKAVEICWLFHLVGDLHQPLHSSALFSKPGFPDGDRGGNTIKLVSTWNLHSYWDGTIGDTTGLSAISSLASRLISDPEYHMTGSKSATDDVSTWLQESHEAAKTHGYTAEIIDNLINQQNDLPEGESFGRATEKIELSDAYKSAAKSIATKRIVQAGYRMAALMKSLL